MNVSESLYTTIEGPKGVAEVYEVTQDQEKDAAQKENMASARVSDVLYEVRFGDKREGFWQEGDACSFAMFLAGLATEDGTFIKQ